MKPMLRMKAKRVYIFVLLTVLAAMLIPGICRPGNLADKCLECHRKMAEHLSSVNIRHGALKRRSCTICHEPHATDYPRQLKKPAKELCAGCHKEFGLKISGSRYIHRPVEEDMCGVCHDPHGSDFTNLLKIEYIWEWDRYPFETAGRLCWNCHNRDIALVERATGLTGFQNGGRNLHFVHVNRKKGRRCISCHDMHAGNQEKRIRPEVPFVPSGWVLPIEFTKTPTGGNCVVGCHRQLSYDRLDPFIYEQKKEQPQ